MKVLVCGGGIGGLTVANALQDGADVHIVDRDASAGATGGYRLHVNAAGCAVLERHLASSLMRDIRATSDSSSEFSAFTITDQFMRPIATEAQPADEDRLLCNRVALRSLLAGGLRNPVTFGRRVVRVIPGRKPTAELDDGTTLEADLIIGAEGASSPTVSSLAGSPTARRTGLQGIAGAYTFRDRDEVPPALLAGPLIAISPRGHGLFLSLAGCDQHEEPLSPKIRELRPPPSLVWGLITRRAALPRDLPRDGEALRSITHDLLEGFEHRIRAMVVDSDPADVATYAFRAVDPRSDLTPWPATNITAIGDAVHCMPPTGGQAAATAIRDAGALADALLSCSPGPDGIRQAIATYQSRMPSWAVPAVRESLLPARIINWLGIPGAPLLAAFPLRIAGSIGHARYRELW